MSRALITESYLTSIANAIRAKLGVQDTYTPPQMAAAIESIPTGGITPTGTKNIAQNGTHDVTEYASANVNVQPNLQSKTATQNGTVTPDQGYDGLSSVVVNVSGGGGGVDTGTIPPSNSSGSDGDLYIQRYAGGILSSTGGATIDTGIKPNALFSVIAQVRVDTTDTRYSTFFGCRNGSNARFTARFGDSANAALVYHKSPGPSNTYSEYTSSIFTKGNMVGTFNTIELGIFVKENATPKNYFSSINTSAFPYSIYLFNNNNAGSVGGDYGNFSMKTFFVLNENGEIVQYLIPAEDSGEACMYDLVTGTLHKNIGGGSFSYTADGATADRLLWRKSNGVWAPIAKVG